MPRIARMVSAVTVARAQEPGRHAVGGVAGLALVVTKSGAKCWVLRTMAAGRRREFGLGGYPSVTLEQARERAREARDLIRKGIDPARQRQKAADALRAAEAKRLTFRKAAEQFVDRKLIEFRNAKHGAQWSRTLETYAYPVIGNLSVDQIDLGHIKRILDPIWTEKTETAKRLRGRIEAVLSYATASGFRSGDNPARWRGNLDAVMPKPGKIARVQHHRALPVDDLPDFMRSLRTREGIAPRALEFLILTAARSGEVRGARWSEIDMAARTWTVPADRMKAHREHVVPLSQAAIQVLESIPKRDEQDEQDWLFAAPRGGALSDMALSALTRRMGADVVPHGFRSTFRDWAAERTNYPREVAEKALAHTISNAVEAAYRRGDLLEKRRRMMDEWARFCERPSDGATVLSLKRGTA